jgi:energy-coupling factor transporter transmembrane protein EcfT
MTHLCRFIPGTSFFHRLDARVKIGAVILLSPFILRGRGWEIALLSALFGAVALVSRLGIARLTEALKPLAFFTALLFCLHVFFSEGTPLVQLSGLPVGITHEGLSRGLLVSWQFLVLVLSGALLTMTTSPSDLVHGLEKLLHPLQRLRIPTQDLAVMVAMALRFVPTFLEELDRIRTARKARGAEDETGRIAERLKASAGLVIPLMTSALRRADELADAMEARGYARGPRTTLNRSRFGADELAAMAGLLLFLAVVVATRYYGWS